MYRVSIQLQKHKWTFGRTRNAVGTQAAGGCFHSFFKFSQLSRVFLYLDRNTENMSSISFRKHHDKEKENSLL